jgi:glycosyltransferase involved in cell wall biosynthesis
MHVFFDDQVFVSQATGGISRYFVELARGLGQTGVQPHVFGGFTRNLYIKTLTGAPGVQTRFRPRRDQLRINTTVARLSRIWRRWDFAQAARRWPAVVYHATGYDADPWIARRAQVTCLTVFDMIGELFGDETSRNRSLALKRSAVRLANGIFCISEQTRRDFLALFPDNGALTRVTPLATSLPDPPAQAKMIATQYAPYLLLVGKRHGYKNGITAMRAFAQLAKTQPNLKLVCFGGEPLSGEEEEVLSDPQVRRRVLPTVGDDTLLAGVYLQAAALLYPSRYEGFGLPVLEAMQLGCPVITTQCASLPEVAGEAAMFVAPDDAAGFAAAAERLLTDPLWRHDRVAAGGAQARRFSWALTAGQTKTAYDQLLGGTRSENGAGDTGARPAFSTPQKA